AVLASEILRAVGFTTIFDDGRTCAVGAIDPDKYLTHLSRGENLRCLFYLSYILNHSRVTFLRRVALPSAPDADKNTPARVHVVPESRCVLLCGIDHAGNDNEGGRVCGRYVCTVDIMNTNRAVVGKQCRRFCIGCGCAHT